MRSLHILIFGFFIFCAPIVGAQNTPIPPNKKTEIGALDQKLKTQSEQKKALEEELAQQEQSLTDTKKNLVETAKSIQKSERRLQDLDLKIQDLEGEYSAAKDKIQADQAAIAELVLALSRLRRMPPEAMIARPGAPLQAAQSAMLLRDIVPKLQHQADSLKESLAVLNVAATDLQNQRQRAAEETQRLMTQQETLTALVDQRAALYASTHKDYKEQVRKVAQISAQSKNLADLVRKLEQERKERAVEKQKNQMAYSAKKYQETPPLAGTGRMPLAGTLKTRFNEPDNFGAPSQGIDIEGRPGSLVIAPMGGVIQFAGFFKNYGNMVIIEHEKGWHSLIAGFEKIDTVVGQSVNAGEPLGTLHKSTTGSKPVLYYELRHNGKAVNPAKKIANLSS